MVAEPLRCDGGIGPLTRQAQIGQTSVAVDFLPKS
jgi:hypothetical protein